MPLDQIRRLVQAEARRLNVPLREYLRCLFPYSQLSQHIVINVIDGIIAAHAEECRAELED